MHIDPKVTEGIVEKYKKIIINQFYPARGDPKLQYSVAKKALTDFMKVCKEPSAIIDMKLTYVGAGLDCTLMYGRQVPVFLLCRWFKKEKVVMK